MFFDIRRGFCCKLELVYLLKSHADSYDSPVGATCNAMYLHLFPHPSTIAGLAKFIGVTEFF